MESERSNAYVFGRKNWAEIERNEFSWDPPDNGVPCREAFLNTASNGGGKKKEGTSPQFG